MLMANELAKAFEAHDLVSDDVVGLDFRVPRCWRALVAISSREQRAADWLREARIRAYWPNYSTSEPMTQLPSRRHFRQGRLRALIAGFIFVAVKFGSEIDLGAIVDNTPGIIGYMRDGSGMAATITERDIGKIREIEGDQNRPPPAKHVHTFKVGQKVRFKKVPEWQGKIMEFCSDGRISVGVPLLGQVAPVKGLPHQMEVV